MKLSPTPRRRPVQCLAPNRVSRLRHHPFPSMMRATLKPPKFKLVRSKREPPHTDTVLLNQRLLIYDTRHLSDFVFFVHRYSTIDLSFPVVYDSRAFRIINLFSHFLCSHSSGPGPNGLDSTRLNSIQHYVTPPLYLFSFVVVRHHYHRRS